MFKRKIFFLKRKSFSPEKKFNVKKSSTGITPRRNWFKNTLVGTFKILGLATILIIVGFGIYNAYRYIFNLRQKKDLNNVENVYGFNIPSYPGSEFIFKDSTENDVVSQFLSLGNSVYRLPKDTTINDVFEYYKLKLKNLGWEHVLTVPLSSEEKMYGEYFIKENKGLRIYSRLNDVWYQSLSTKQALNGLEDQVKKETARKLLLLTTDKTDLLPDFPWRLSYPSEYQTKYYLTTISSIQGVRFQKLGSNTITYLEPVGYFGAMTLDDYISKYLDTYNKKNKTKWQVINSVEVDFHDQNAIRGTITNGSENAYIYSINNTGNSVVYVTTSFEENEPFLNYVFNNIKPSSQNTQ